MWEKKPVLLIVMATCAILVGTIVTMVLPFAWVNTEADRIEGVTPYTALQQEGRDVYIREGCNNCHTQTVRPLVSDVLRYGEYSKSVSSSTIALSSGAPNEPARTWPASVASTLTAWHYKHMDSPRSMVPKTNMPDYDWLADYKLDPEMIQRKMEVLDFPYTAEEIKALAGKNEMDAIVAYMQKLGSDIPWREATATEIVGELVNPYTGVDHDTMEPWEALYTENCAACHGEHMEGEIGPELVGEDYDDEILFELIYSGITDGGMPAFSSLGTDKVWKLVNFIKYYNQGEDH